MNRDKHKHKYYYLLLVIIYIGYVSLGLPDTVLGVAWPTMRIDLHRSVEWAGLLSTLIILCSSLSGFSSGLFINRVPAGILLMISCFMTGFSLMGFSFAPSFTVLLILGIPLGLGGGCIDAAMNSYIARHYSSKHMIWLHGNWGVGATVGPIIMTSMIAAGHSWRGGYLVISSIQLALGIVFLCSLKLWMEKKASPHSQSEKTSVVVPPERKRVYKDLSAWYSVISFFCYCGVEYGFGLWGATFLINARGFSPESAGYAVSLYWGALTAGRFISGCVADHIGNRKMVYAGIGLCFCGVLILGISSNTIVIWSILLLMGMSLAPIYPCMMHETARRFSEKRANVVIGFQSGSACLGIAVLPSLFGVLSGCIGFASLPFILLAILLGLLTVTVLLNRRT